jgi:hypothetical protein
VAESTERIGANTIMPEPIKRDLKNLSPDADRLLCATCRVFAKKMQKIPGVTEDQHLAGMLELLENGFMRLASDEADQRVYLQMLTGWDKHGKEIWITVSSP